MLKKLKISEIKIDKEFKEFFAPLSPDELLNSIRQEGLKMLPYIDKNNVLVDGFRRLECLKLLGWEEVECLYDSLMDASIKDRILQNEHRVKTSIDEVRIIRETFIKFPKKQGKKNTDGIKYVRDEEITTFLSGRFKGDGIIKKLEFVADTEIEKDVLMLGIVSKGWKVETCYDYIKIYKQIDEENNYGYGQQIIDGTLSVSDANKFIERHYELDKNYKPTFVIPNRAEVINGDSRYAQELLGDTKFDLLFTSIPYWKKRKYDGEGETQLGHEEDKHDFAKNIAKIIAESIPNMKETGNVIINVGETFKDGLAQGIPHLVKHYIEEYTPLLYKSTTIWSKTNAFPQNEKVKRLNYSYEDLLWFVLDPKKAYYQELTFPSKEKEIKISSGAKNVSADGKVAKKSKSISNPYGKFTAHLHEQEVLDVIYTSIGENHEIKKIFPSSHPALMSPALPVTFILMACPEGGVVYEPFSGGATTGKCALLLNRKYVGIEKSKLYFGIGNKVLENANNDFNQDELNEINSLVFPQLNPAA